MALTVRNLQVCLRGQQDNKVFSHYLGKQARRTGTSSPLGELFDHGCDSWAAVFITSTFYNTFGRNQDGYSISIKEMYFIHINVFLSFYLR